MTSARPELVDSDRHSLDHDPRGVILHIVTRYLRGGSERRISDAIASIRSHRHQAIIGGESNLELASRLLDVEDLTIEPSLVRDPNPLSDFRALTRLARSIRERSPDIVFTHQSKAGALGRMASRMVGGPPVVHSLSMASFGPGYSPTQSRVFRWLEKRLASSTAAYAVVGNDLVQRYREAGIPKEKLHLIRSGVPLPTVNEPQDLLKAQLGAEHGIPVDRPWLIHLGSLEERKNVSLLPLLLERIHSLTGDALPHLVLVGEGPQRPAVEELIAEHGLTGHATFTGYVDGPAPLLKASDCLVLLSSVEGLPQVLVQAASLGTPFVAFDVEGVREVVEIGATGEAVTAGDLEAAAGAVANLLDSRPDARRVDLTSWTEESIGNSYRRLVDEVLRPG